MNTKKDGPYIPTPEEIEIEKERIKAERLLAKAASHYRKTPSVCNISERVGKIRQAKLKQGIW